MNKKAPLSAKARNHLFKMAAVFPRQLETLVVGLSEQELVKRSSALEFSIHQQVWHLADLETEGYAKRIRYLLDQSITNLPDFNGSDVAAQRQYHTLSFKQGLRTFADARLHNLWVLSGVDSTQWLLSGHQDNVGQVTMSEVFGSMVDHDQSHLAEIQFLLSGEKNFRAQEPAAA